MSRLYMSRLDMSRLEEYKALRKRVDAEIKSMNFLVRLTSKEKKRLRMKMISIGLGVTSEGFNLIGDLEREVRALSEECDRKETEIRYLLPFAKPEMERVQAQRYREMMKEERQKHNSAVIEQMKRSRGNKIKC